jgi:hypothetical protein
MKRLVIHEISQYRNGKSFPSFIVLQRGLRVYSVDENTAYMQQFEAVATCRSNGLNCAGGKHVAVNSRTVL